MTNAQMLAKVDEILKVLPADVVSVSLAYRYGGLNELQSKILQTVDLLQRLKADLS